VDTPRRRSKTVSLCALRLLMLLTLLPPLVVAVSAEAAILNLSLTDDRDGGDHNGDGIYDHMAPIDLHAVRAYVAPNTYDLRAAWEFSLAGIPAGSQINSATFTPKLSVASGGPEVSTVTFHGYNGNGAVELADVVSTINPLATLNMFNGTFATNVALAVQDALDAGASHVGIMAKGFQGQIAFQSKESLEVPAPAATLVVNYTVPEPSTAAATLAAAGGIALLRRQRAGASRALHP
jgi:hypothetical protein